MRKNCSILFLIMVIAFSALLSACGNASEVPDKYIDYAVQDFINNKYLLPERGYENYEFSAKHNPDKSSHTDEVDVTAQIIYPYGEVIFQGSQIYQYSSGDDNWSEMDSWSWDEISRSINTNSIIGTWTGDYYELNIEAIDFNAGTVTCSYSVSVTKGSPWTRGGMEQVTYTGRDTFLIEGYDNDRIIIKEADNSFYVEFSAEHGVRFGRWG